MHSWLYSFEKIISRLVETKVRTDFGKVYQEKGELKEIICLGFLKYFSQFGHGSDSGRTVFEQGLDKVWTLQCSDRVFGQSVRTGFIQGLNSGQTVFEQGLDKVRTGSDSAVFGQCSNSVRTVFGQGSDRVLTVFGQGSDSVQKLFQG